MTEHDVIVVGAGMAGLACASALTRSGRSPLVLERSDSVGGRVRTDAVDGFLLDHGFQVLPLAYPEARAALDFEGLELGLFERGAIIRAEGRFRRLADPRHDPVRSLRALAGGLVGVRDGAAVLRLLHDTGDETTAADALRRAGVSRTTVETFFAPFLRGVFLEPSLTTSSRFLDFVLQAFSDGPAALPREGMGAIANQLAAGLDCPQAHRRRDGRPARRLTRVRRAASRRRGRRRDGGPRRRAGPRLERRHVRLLRRSGKPDSGTMARRQRRRRPDQQPRGPERGGSRLRPRRTRARLGDDPRRRGARPRCGLAPTGWLVRQGRGRVASSRHLPDPESVALLPGRRLRRAAGAPRGRPLRLW